MPKRVLSGLFVVAVFASLSRSAVSQTAPVRVPEPLPRHPGMVARAPHPHQPPCWEEAGISKSAMEQRRLVQQRTHAEVEAVCADPSLSPQQRQQRIRQIQQQGKMELDALVSPQQMEALKSCQMSRNHGGGHPGGGHPGVGGGHGPCGELPSRSGPAPHPPNPSPNPSPGEKPEPEIEN